MGSILFFKALNKINLNMTKSKLEQLECLHSEDTRHHLMITHTIKSY